MGWGNELLLVKFLSTNVNTFTAKHLKKPIPQGQACLKDSWILRVYVLNTEYLQKSHISLETKVTKNHHHQLLPPSQSCIDARLVVIRLSVHVRIQTKSYADTVADVDPDTKNDGIGTKHNIQIQKAES